jgi:hypothetical protein
MITVVNFYCTLTSNTGLYYSISFFETFVIRGWRPCLFMSKLLSKNLLSSFHFRLQEDPPAGVSGAPSENNIMLWNAVIFG